MSIGLAALINAGWLMWGLYRCGAWQPTAGWWAYLLKVFAACAALATVLFMANRHIAWLELQAQPLQRVLWLAAVLALAGGLYLGLLWVMGLRLSFFRRSE